MIYLLGTTLLNGIQIFSKRKRCVHTETGTLLSTVINIKINYWWCKFENNNKADEIKSLKNNILTETIYIYITTYLSDYLNKDIKLLLAYQTHQSKII